MGSRWGRRLARVSAAAIALGILLLVLGTFVVPPSSSSTLCTGGTSASPGDPGVTCETSSSGSPVLDAVVLGGSGLALVVCVLSLVACLVVVVRADVRARARWRPSGEVAAAPPSAALRLAGWGIGVIALGLLGGFAASSLVDGAVTFAPFRLPDQSQDLYLLISEDYVRLGLALTLGVAALVAQWLAVLLLLGAAGDAVAVALAGGRSVEEPAETVR